MRGVAHRTCWFSGVKKLTGVLSVQLRSSGFRKLKERCDALQVPCELVFPGSETPKYPAMTDFLIARLKGLK